jgi:hypothetical protein
MRTSIRCLTISRFTVAVAAIWMYGAGSAWAGGGGESLTTLQNLISDICGDFGVSNCPDTPTVTQAVLAVAALENSPPEMVRALNSIAPGSALDAGNAAAVPPTPFPLTTTTSPTLSEFLSTLKPLAFISSQQGTTPAVPAQLYDPNANTFFYAVASGTTVALTGLTEPTALLLFHEDVSRIVPVFLNSQIVAKVSVPLTTFNTSTDTENPAVITTLEVVATCTGGPSCLQAYAIGGIGTPTKPIPVANLGINFAAVFSASPISTIPHLIFEFAVPQLVTEFTDQLHFWFANLGEYGPINLSIPSAFFTDDDGSCPGASSLGCIGITPNPGPLVSSSGSLTFALCASLPDNLGLIHPAVSAYYALATSGEVLISRALSSTSVCPF